MSVAGTERRRQLVTAGLGTALTLVMGTVLIVGFRLATHMRADIAALQAASTLQTYPEEISHQLNSLRDRLEVRAYSGQALADLQATVKRFDQELKQINAAGGVTVGGKKMPLELILLDDESDATKTVARLETLAAQGVVGYLGGFGSDLHAAAASVAICL